MKYRYLLFDLDGTISDPQEGIVNCLNHALEHHGFPRRPAQELQHFIGPPLDYTFGQLTHSGDEALITQLVAKYRERYGEVGYRENALYAGIPDMLAALEAMPDLRIGLCTSKRADFARRILELFGIDHYFSFLSGGDVGVAKSSQIEVLIDEGTIGPAALMIGDRHFDITAAKNNGLDAVAVTWGYGSLAELTEYGADHIIDSPQDLVTLIDSVNSP